MKQQERCIAGSANFSIYHTQLFASFCTIGASLNYQRKYTDAKSSSTIKLPQENIILISYFPQCFIDNNYGIIFGNIDKSQKIKD